MLRNLSQWWDSWNMQRNFDLHNTFKSYITTCITLDQDVSHIERRASWRGDTAGGGCQWGSSLLGSRECHPKVTWAGAEVNITSFSNFIMPLLTRSLANDIDNYVIGYLYWPIEVGNFPKRAWWWCNVAKYITNYCIYVILLTLHIGYVYINSQKGAVESLVKN